MRIPLTFDVPRELALPALQALIDVLQRVNEAWIAEHPKAPALEVGGVRYRAERGERWQSAPALLRARRGDCEDLAAYEAAWLTRRGIPARAYIRRSRGGPSTYHAVVRLADGRTSDPSARLGMGRS